MKEKLLSPFLAKGRGSFFFFRLPKLVTVPEIVPNAVETTCDTCHGCHESVAQPNDEHSVLLSTSLGSANGVLIFQAHASAEVELHEACYK